MFRTEYLRSQKKTDTKNHLHFFQQLVILQEQKPIDSKNQIKITFLHFTKIIMDLDTSSTG